MNALLQAFSVLTGFWSTLPAVTSEEKDISPLLAAYCQIMFLLKPSINPIDPSCFINGSVFLFLFLSDGNSIERILIKIVLDIQ